MNERALVVEGERFPNDGRGLRSDWERSERASPAWACLEATAAFSDVKKLSPLPSLALPDSFIINATWQNILKELMQRVKHLYNQRGFRAQWVGSLSLNIHTEVFWGFRLVVHGHFQF